MKKAKNKEAYFERLRNLSDIKKGGVNESKTRTLGNLIDYKRGADNVAYGIVKENHHYYLKKSNKQTEPDISDFAYIGGLQNITNYQYNTLSEADKNRNMLLLTINEALSRNLNKKTITESDMDDGKGKNIDDYDQGKKEMEENAEEEIEKSVEAATELDAATEKEKSEEPEIDIEVPETDAEVSVDSQDDNSDVDVDAVIDTPEPEEDNDTETKEPETGGGEDATDENNREIQKTIGKLTNKIRNTEMTPSQVQSYMNSLIASFEDKLPELEIEERKEMANKILKVVPEEDIENIELPKDEDLEEGNEKICEECGFAHYVDERGYDADSIMECGPEEMANLMSGYIMKNDDDLNDEDYESMAVFTTPEIEESLQEEYGHDNISEKIKPYTDKLNEVEDTEKSKKDKVNGMFWWKLDPKKKKTNEKNIDETINGKDPAAVEVQPNINEEEEIEDNNSDDFDLTNHNEPELGITQGFENMGVDVIKPETAETKTVDLTVNKETGTINVNMHESEIKLRKYIRSRLEEITGNKKSSINENKKSDKIKKLDKMIEKQYRLFESYLKEETTLDELFGQSLKKKFEKLNPQDETAVNNLFYDAFKQSLKMAARKQHADKMPIETKYSLLKQGYETDALNNPSFALKGGEYIYAPLKLASQFKSGGTMGKTSAGGV